jgi:hypothetical protein
MGGSGKKKRPDLPRLDRERVIQEFLSSYCHKWERFLRLLDNFIDALKCIGLGANEIRRIASSRGATGDTAIQKKGWIVSG